MTDLKLANVAEPNLWICLGDLSVVGRDRRIEHNDHLYGHAVVAAHVFMSDWIL
jgi:hypothetical protein